jgi:ABC-type glycerol-3-phosphate transport system substrate-binding protein
LDLDILSREIPMKSKIILFMLLSVLILAGCGQEKLEGNMKLLNQDKDEITFPQEKPTLFFFITTYT